MSLRNKSVRILKFLGKTLVWLLLLLLALLLLVHLAFVQKRITRYLGGYLSTELASRVEIDRIGFSLLGDLSVDGLRVWDPDSNKILSVGKFKVTSNIRDLFSGKYIFSELHLKDVEANLEEREDGLSIQYILDIFGKTATKDPTVSVTTEVLTLQFNDIIFENIAFTYRSVVSRSDFSIKLAKGSGKNVMYSSGPDNSKASAISLDGAVVNILVIDTTSISMASVPTADSIFFTPDFGLGIGLDIDTLDVKQSAFTFHTNQVVITPKFDPSHISIKEVNAHLTGITMSDDSLYARVPSIAAQMPGFILKQAAFDLQMDRHHLSLPSLKVETGESELHGSINIGYDVSSVSINVHPNIDGSINAKINPKDLAYFLEEDVVTDLGPLKDVQVKVTGNYVNGIGNLDTLTLQTANSEVRAMGLINDIMHKDKLAWTNIKVQATLGPDFRNALTPYFDVSLLPPDLKIDLTSSGNLNRMFIDGNVNSSWGNLNAKGNVIPMNENISLDMALTGDRVQLNHWVELPWIGQMNFALKAKGTVGKIQDVDIKGVIHSIDVMDEQIHNITFDSEIIGTEVIANIDIGDSSYLARGHVELDYGGPILIKSQLHLKDFSIGEFVSYDSTLAISGEINSEINIDDATIVGNLRGQDVMIHRQTIDYLMDTLSMDVLISPTASKLDYYALDGVGHLESNFDIQELPAILKQWSKSIIDSTHQLNLLEGNKEMTFDFELTRPDPIQLLGIDVEHFTSLHIKGDLYQAKHGLDLEITSGGFVGQGVSLDTIHSFLEISGDSIRSSMRVTNLLYNTYDLGDLEFSLKSTGDTANAHLFLLRDSIAFLGLGTRILPTTQGFYFYPDTLLAFGQDYLFDRNNPISVMDGNVRFDNFHLSQADMKMTLDGDVYAFKMDFTNLDLVQLNQIIAPDTAIVTYGHLTGSLSYIKDQELNLDAHVDSLSLYGSLPLKVTITAERTNDQVPFQFLLSNASNKIDINGRYFSNTETVEGSMKLDVTELDNFLFLVSEYLGEMDGTIRGEVTFKGPLEKPVINGNLRFLEVDLTTANPPFNFHIKDEAITLDNSGIFFKDFKFFDKRGHPLTIDGSITTKEYDGYTYDLKIHADQYSLLNNTGKLKEQLTGILEVSADVSLKGNEEDTYVNADIVIEDTTDLVFIVRNDDIVILESEGIVDFVDPGQLVDSTALEDSGNFYDSLINSLPDFNLTCNLVIEDQARLKVITNEQSGDYFLGRGGGKLDMEYDRTGNLHLIGSYTINEGVYRMSFYDLVKRNFNLVKGSSIVWSGSPEKGDLDIKAVHIVKSNSIGLIGDEIGENEQSVYKRSLDYEVGIVIKGTIDKPIVSFTLDLPEKDRANYPVLASKLDRLKLPEFQSELNKQVFGLLVLGGFLPETSGEALNENLIATTAVSNSINSLLASQLNRFANQYIKGVNIDIGIQSYSDYSAPGGKTQTTMDFHLSKSFLDERLSFEVGGDFDINTDQSGSNTGKNYRGDVAIIYDLTGRGDKQLKLFNNESYDIIYQEIRNTGISLIFIREFNKNQTEETKDK